MFPQRRMRTSLYLLIARGLVLVIVAEPHGEYARAARRHERRFVVRIGCELMQHLRHIAHVSVVPTNARTRECTRTHSGQTHNAMLKAQSCRRSGGVQVVAL